MLAKEARYKHLHRVWRLLPEGGRRFLFHRIIPLLAPLPDANPPARPPVSVLGPFRSSIGIGWGARANAELLEGSDFDFRFHDITEMLLAGDLPRSGLREAGAVPGGAGVLLIYANPPHVPYIFLHLRGEALREKYVVAHATWELPELYPEWQRDLRFVHRIWCPSEFAAGAFRRATDKPVRVIPYAVEPPANLAAKRAEFGLHDDALVVLLPIHLASGLSRKNPVAGIQAFRRAFPTADNAILLVKVSQGAAYPERLAIIKKAIAGARNIRLIQKTLSDADYWKLMQCIDVVLSLHRSEGFGLVPAQAMALGKIAVATGWSGNLEYMTERNSLPVDYSLTPVRDPEGNYGLDEQRWAEPSVEHASELLRKVADDSALRSKLGQAAAQTMSANFSAEAVAAVITQELSDLGPLMP